MARGTGLELWGPLGRWIFLNWPRGSWQYDLTCAAIIAALFVLPGPQRPAAAPPGLEAVLAAVREAGEGLRSFTAEMVATKRHALFPDEVEVERGRVAYLRPGYLLREVREPTQRVEVVAGGLLQIYIPRIKQVQRLRLEPAGGAADLAIPGLVATAGLEEGYEVELLGVEGSADGPLYVLRLLPEPEAAAARHWRAVTLWLPEGTWLPARRILLEEHNGDTETIELRSVDRNPGLSPRDFELRLPADVEVVEHRRPAAGG